MMESPRNKHPLKESHENTPMTHAGYTRSQLAARRRSAHLYCAEYGISDFWLREKLGRRLFDLISLFFNSL